MGTPELNVNYTHFDGKPTELTVTTETKHGKQNLDTNPDTSNGRFCYYSLFGDFGQFFYEFHGDHTRFSLPSSEF
jgi:hypothetical protein